MLISVFLFLVAVALMVSHGRFYRWAEEHAADEEELRFRRRQYRLRMQCSVLLAALGVGLLAGDMVNARVESLWIKGGYWGVMLVLVVWMGLSAVADMLSTKYFFGRLRDENMIEQAKLRAELRKIQSQSKEGNGAADGNPLDEKSEEKSESGDSGGDSR